MRFISGYTISGLQIKFQDNGSNRVKSFDNFENFRDFRGHTPFLEAFL